MKHNNSAKEKFLTSVPTSTLGDAVTDMKCRMAFSFKYFDNTQVASGVGQDFTQWTQKQLVELWES